ncbi:head-tail adaptor protein [Sulfuricurvum sp.]|uniref:head-tail adaptor protein n=1 Tax=Sulfuricurvum sp. TaxID=2025608 RepID=UPI003BB0E758
MRHKIEFVTIGEIRGAMGGVSEGETHFGYARAEIKPISGGERFMSNQLFAEATSQIRCRFVAGITRKHKIKFGTRTFDILDVQNKEEKSVELFIVAKEIL